MAARCDIFVTIPHHPIADHSFAEGFNFYVRQFLFPLCAGSKKVSNISTMPKSPNFFFPERIIYLNQYKILFGLTSRKVFMGTMRSILTYDITADSA